MKKRELQGLRAKETVELKKLLPEKKVEWVKAKTGLKASKEKNLKKAKNLSKEIAQISTIIREKEIMEKGLQTPRPQISSQKAQK